MVGGLARQAYAVPAGGALGTGATDFFCEAVGAGSNAVRRAAEDPLPVIGVLLALLAVVVFLLTRATWRPTAPLHLAHRRAWGQVLAAAARMYLKRMPLFVGIGLLFLPISVVITFLQAVFLGLRASSASTPTQRALESSFCSSCSARHSPCSPSSSFGPRLRGRSSRSTRVEISGPWVPTDSRSTTSARSSESL